MFLAFSKVVCGNKYLSILVNGVQSLSGDCCQPRSFSILVISGMTCELCKYIVLEWKFIKFTFVENSIIVHMLNYDF